MFQIRFDATWQPAPQIRGETTSAIGGTELRASHVTEAELRNALTVLTAFLGFSHDPFSNGSFPFCIVQPDRQYPLFQRHGHTQTYELNMESTLSTLMRAAEAHVVMPVEAYEFLGFAHLFWPAEHPLISHICPQQLNGQSPTPARDNACNLIDSENPVLTIIGYYIVTAMDLTANQDSYQRELLKYQLSCLHHLNRIIVGCDDAPTATFTACLKTLLPLQISHLHQFACSRMLEADLSLLVQALIDLRPVHEQTFNHAQLTLLVAKLLHIQNRQFAFELLQHAASAGIMPNTPRFAALMILFPYIDEPMDLLDVFYRLPPKGQLSVVNDALDIILSQQPLRPFTFFAKSENRQQARFIDAMNVAVGDEPERISEEAYQAVCACIEMLEDTQGVAVRLSLQLEQTLFLCALRWSDSRGLEKWRQHLNQTPMAWMPAFCQRIAAGVIRANIHDVRVAEIVAATMLKSPVAFGLHPLTGAAATQVARCLIDSSEIALLPTAHSLLRGYDIQDKELWPNLLEKVVSAGDSQLDLSIGADFFQRPVDMGASEADACAGPAQALAERLPLDYCDAYLGFCHNKLRPDEAECKIVSYFHAQANKDEGLAGEELQKLREQLFDAQQQIYFLPTDRAEYVFDELRSLFERLDIPQPIRQEYTVIKRLLDTDPQSASLRIKHLLESPFRQKLEAAGENFLPMLSEIYQSHQQCTVLTGLINEIFKSPNKATNHRDLFFRLKPWIESKLLTKEDLHTLLSRYMYTLRPTSKAPDYRTPLVSMAVTAGYYTTGNKDAHYCHIHLLLNAKMPEKFQTFDYAVLKKLIADHNASFTTIPLHPACRRSIDLRKQALQQKLKKSRQYQKFNLLHAELSRELNAGGQSAEEIVQMTKKLFSYFDTSVTYSKHVYGDMEQVFLLTLDKFPEKRAELLKEFDRSHRLVKDIPPSDVESVRRRKNAILNCFTSTKRKLKNLQKTLAHTAT